MSEPQILPFESSKQWAAWLKKNYQLNEGIWLKIAKKDSGIATVTYAEALDVALCWGWIDGQKKSFDAQFFLQKFTPRRARSIWSKVNCGKVEALIASGSMQAPGLAEVERAKADGRWEAAYESQSRMAVPDDLQLALAKNKRAAAFFQTLKSQNRYAILFRVHNAKRPETRQKRIAQYVEMLAKHETIH